MPQVENLLAACQLCHLRIDHGHHRVTRSITLAARAAAAGQLGLLPETVLTRTEPPTPPRPTRDRAPAAALHQLPFPEPAQETKPMAHISVKITPLHPDGTECTHAVSPSGKPRDPDVALAGPELRWSVPHERPLPSRRPGRLGAGHHSPPALGHLRPGREGHGEQARALAVALDPPARRTDH
ncbi:hypothetical protein ABTX77_35850 [Streptomyces sp. NPDC097704]|uniref:hypothetical protein n=1 Tax=Streptomyces sp. NPDC097704 TaxID=3157101 RepID=UPI0033241FAF